MDVTMAMRFERLPGEPPPEKLERDRLHAAGQYRTFMAAHATPTVELLAEREALRAELHNSVDLTGAPLDGLPRQQRYEMVAGFANRLHTALERDLTISDSLRYKAKPRYPHWVWAGWEDAYEELLDGQRQEIFDRVILHTKREPRDLRLGAIDAVATSLGLNTRTVEWHLTQIYSIVSQHCIRRNLPPLQLPPLRQPA